MHKALSLISRNEKESSKSILIISIIIILIMIIRKYLFFIGSFDFSILSSQ
jgi:hypothetical protein